MFLSRPFCGGLSRSAIPWLVAVLLFVLFSFPVPVLAATITVTTLEDVIAADGECSLREAIQNANTDSRFYNNDCAAGSGTDTITFSVSGTIVLESALNIITPVIIQGPIILSGDETTRLFNVGNNGELTLLNLTVRDGRSTTAGAIDANNGSLNLAGVSFINNVATGSDGGAIRAGRSLSILGSNFSGNQAEQRGGAILFTGGASDRLLISTSNFSGNLAGQRGGAIAAPSTSKISLFDTVFSGNIVTGSQASHGGGAVYIDNGRDDNEIIIERTAFNGNLSLFGSGGALYINDDIPTHIRDSSFNGNASGGSSYSGRGGAIFIQNGNLDVRRVTFNGNLTAAEGQGGAIHQAGTGSVTAVTNTSFFANAAPNGQGGALRVAAGQMQLRNVTLAGNAASTGSALNNNGTVQVWNSILSGSAPVCSGIAPQNQGFNLQHPDLSCGGGITSADPRLESPSFNGGPLSSLITMALRPDSPAIDAGDSAVCAAAPVNNEDQRGQPRPRDGNGDGNPVCDIGAYETVARFAGYGSTPIQPGPIMVGTTTMSTLVSGIFTVFETGNADLILSQPFIGGEHAATFSLATSFPLTIANGAPPVEIEIVCLSSMTGTHTATLSILTNDPNRPEVVYNLLCEVTAAPTAGFGSIPDVPGPLDFGPVFMGETGVVTFALNNTGTVDLILGPVSLSGNHAADFSVDFIPHTVPWGHAAIDATIHCTPSSVGLRTAQLHLFTSDPAQPQVSFNLVCQGEPPPLQPLSSPGQTLFDHETAGIYLGGASDVAVSPDGLHVYATARYSSAVTAFSRDAQTGELTPVSAIVNANLSGANGIAISPDGQQVYVSAEWSTNPFVVLSRNATTGALTEQASFNTAGLSSPYGIAISPNGQHIYVAASGSNSILIYQRQTNHTISYLATITSNTNLSGVYQLAISGDGAYLYATSHTTASNGRIAVYQRNPQTGLLSFKQVLNHNTMQAWPGCPVITILGMAGATGLTLSPENDYLYIASWSSNAIARFKRNADGTLCYLSRTQDGLSGVTGLQGAMNLATSPDGRYLFAVAGISSAVTAFERNPLNGVLTQRQVIEPIGGIPGLVGARGIDICPDGRSVHVASELSSAAVSLPAANPVPSLDRLLPASAQAGTQSTSLTIRGNAFAPNAVVLVNSQSRSTRYVSASELHITLSTSDLASAGSLVIEVVNPEPGGGISINNLTFTVTAPGQNPVPSIEYLSPQAMAGGEPAFTLVIRGTNFINNSQVRWNGSGRATTFTSSSEIRAVVTASDLLFPGTAVVTVHNPGPGGGTSNSVPFQVAAPGLNLVPTITALVPDSILGRGPLSMPLQVTIYGQGFIDNSQARWNGQNRATTYISSNQLRVTLTSGDVAFGGFGAVTVMNPAPGGGVSNPANLTIFGHSLYIPAIFR